MTKQKHAEIALMMRLKGLHTRLNTLLTELWHVECRLEAQGEVKIGWENEPPEVLKKSEQVMSEHLYLTILKARLSREIENTKNEIEAL